ncbi:hypothetical protein NQ315_014039 [Exocentrus adspersus]|uniref:Uncharacterized protein n=1 Tax=Exocentrus adspersus TaxID=1586481 RepID=A0AAV8VV71_9CUCU|nr:hypothetical protein NQ315_014039 [Exocentrus adspersus]
MEWTEEEYQEGRFLKVETNTGKKYEFEEVEQFTYLGSSIFSRKPNIGEEIETRIMAGNKCVAGLRRILRNKNISRQTKIRLYKTVWERKILRKIFEGKRTEEGWIRRTNEEIKNLYGEASIGSVIRAQRLRWLGHIERMNNVRIPKLLMERTIGGKRRRGRPKARWKAEVEKDLQQQPIRKWKKKAKDRMKWRRMVHKAMGLLGSRAKLPTFQKFIKKIENYKYLVTC